MHYQKNFLTNVIWRVDLTGAPELGGPTRPALSEDLGKLFPRWIPKPTAQVSLVVGPQGSTINQEMLGINYEHSKGDKPLPVAVVGKEFVSLEYGEGNYDHFPPFLAEVEQIVASLQKHHPKAQASRIGLRYVNEIKFDQGSALDWVGLIDPELITAVSAAFPAGMKMARSMHQLQAMNYDVSILVNYGLPNLDFPGELVRRHFVIDIDAFRTGVIPLGEIVECVNALNKACETMFESCIGDGLRQHLGVING